jgi:glycosyltransferase involved in cell wall biosynthesis
MGRPSLGYKTFKYEYDVKKISEVIKNFKPDVISSHTFYLSPLVLEANQNLRIPFTLTVHGDLLNYGKEEDKKMFLDMVPKLDKVIAVCDHGNTQLKEKGNIEKGKLELIKYGIDTGLFNKVKADKSEIRRVLKLPQDKFIFVTPARMTYYKGIEFLLKAIERTKNNDKLCFLIATPPARHREDETNYTEKVFSLVSDKGLQDNFALSFFDFNTMPFLYSACDAFILPSMTEQLPVSILEAQASQIPVIATDVGGVSEIVKSQETGFLIKYGDERALVKAIKDVFEKQEFVQGIVEKTRSEIAKQYNKDIMADNYESLFKKILPSKHAG